jgi:hypothetical protein
VHRVAALAALLSACTFAPNQAGPSPDADTGAPTSDGPALFVGCHVHDPSLRLCFDFEEPTLNPVARDGSSFGHDAQTSGIAAMPRAVEQAVALTATSSIYIPPTPDLQLTHLTLEAWIRPDITGSQTDAIANPPQYALGYDGSTVSCAVGDAKVSQPYQAAGAWTHVACTYAGDKIKLYVNGSVIACSDGPRRIDPRTSGTHLGAALVGGLDNVRVFAEAVDGEICDHAGSTGCSTSCPD